MLMACARHLCAHDICVTSACSWHVRGTNMIMTCVWHLRAHDISAASACSSWHVCVASSCSFCHLHGICAHTMSGRHRHTGRMCKGNYTLAASARHLDARHMHKTTASCSPTARVANMLANCSGHRLARRLYGSSACALTARVANMLANCSGHQCAHQLYGSPTCSPTARLIVLLANRSAHQHAGQMHGA